MQGLLLVDKPSGITSFGAAARIRRITHQKRIGHTGTLDPMATGVLPLLLGRATCLADFLICADKRYTATVRLGITTDTLDITGTVLSQSSVSVDDKQLDTVLNSFLGEQDQVPPMFSAIKRDGVPMYELARKGQTLDLPPRRITINSIRLLKPLENGEFVIDVACSKGTYIRSLCRDIGEKLGCGAVLTDLRRTLTAGFGIGNCVPLEAITEENIDNYLLTADKAVDYLNAVRVSQKQAVRFTNGGYLDLNRINFTPKDEDTFLRVYYNDSFLGLGEIDRENSRLNVKCVIFEGTIN